MRPGRLVTVLAIASLATLAAALFLPLARERLLAIGAERLAARYAGVEHAKPLEYYIDRLPLVIDTLRATLVRSGLLGLALTLLVGPGVRLGRGTLALSLAFLLHLTFDLGHFGRGYVPAIADSEIFPRPPEIVFLSDLPGLPRVLPTGRAMPPNSLNAYGIEDFRVHDAVGSAAHQRLEAAMSEAPFLRRPFASYDRALLNIAGVDVLAVEAKERVDLPSHPGFRVLMRGGVTLLENEQAWPRAFLCTTARQAASDSAAIAAARAMVIAAAADSAGAAPPPVLPDEIPLTPAATGRAVASPRLWRVVRLLYPAVGRAPSPALVREAPIFATADDSLESLDSLEGGGGARSPAKVEPVPGRPVEIGRLTHSPLVVSAEVNTPRPGWFVLLDQDFPGWEVRVDGTPTPAARAAGLFRAAPVPAGEHTVSWHYRPASFALGLVLALPALVFALVGVALGGAFTRRSSR